ncbi:MAG: tyrosine phosphatase family protein [Gemmatimonadales bacterium]
MIRSTWIRSLVRYDISICGIPELPLFCEAGVSDVLSIIDPPSPEPEAFAGFAPHRRRTLRFDDLLFEAPGSMAPSEADVQAILAFGAALESQGDTAHVLVHCHAGVSRSSAAAALLMAQHNPGREEDAFMALLELRPQAWPNTRMVELADTLLERQGALAAALAAYRRALLRVRPHLTEMVIGVGRSHELPE